MTRAPGTARRALWAGLGLVSVGLGALGVVVPGLPTTVFFIAAAACFSRSSPRLEAWVLGLPRIGRTVRDYRAGLGMPRRAKAAAIATVVVVVALSLWALDGPLVRGGVAAAALVGILVIAVRVPTRERVLAGRRAPAGGTPP